LFDYDRTSGEVGSGGPGGKAMRAIRHPAIEDVELTQVLDALRDPVRLSIVQHLARVGTASCAALDGGRPKSSMSHHFRVLRDSGVVRTRVEGTTHLNELRAAELEARFPGLLATVLALAGSAPAQPASASAAGMKGRPRSRATAS
jgi:DNA-binding transcriptional ArsR family regulator